MTVTDEPGSYEDENFGIRLENVLIVKEADTKFNFGDKGYLSFEHKTWAPYQTKMIDLTLLGPEVINWLNSYHGRCRDILAPYLDESEMAWLNKVLGNPTGDVLIFAHRNASTLTQYLTWFGKSFISTRERVHII